MFKIKLFVIATFAALAVLIFLSLSKARSGTSRSRRGADRRRGRPN